MVKFIRSNFRYFHRFDDEIEQINVKKTIGKRALSQHFSREKSIEITLESDKNEYNTSGLGNIELFLLIFWIKR